MKLLAAELERSILFNVLTSKNGQNAAFLELYSH